MVSLNSFLYNQDSLFAPFYLYDCLSQSHSFHHYIQVKSRILDWEEVYWKILSGVIRGIECSFTFILESNEEEWVVFDGSFRNPMIRLFGIRQPNIPLCYTELSFLPNDSSPSKCDFAIRVCAVLKIFREFYSSQLLLIQNDSNN